MKPFLRRSAHSILIVAAFLCQSSVAENAGKSELQQLIGSLTGDTPQAEDLRYLADVIGGRTTGSAANVRAVDWAMNRFREAGVRAAKEPFTVPKQWLERRTSVHFSGSGMRLLARGVAKQYSATTGPEGSKAPLIGIGMGTESDFLASANNVNGAWVLVNTAEVVDLNGLFGEYEHAIAVEPLAHAYGAKGIIYQSPRSEGILHRLVLFSGVDLPVLYIERQEANRLSRLLASGSALQASAIIDVDVSEEFQSHNVIGELEGTDLKHEIVLIGAHLDSHALGTGAIDNGGNVTILLDIARQMQDLGIRTRRTIRFALWNGEEQGFLGSWSYTKQHADELDNHVLAASIDVGEGPITGFFTNGRGSELAPILDLALAPVAGLGPFSYPDVALVGTDNYDFILNGVPNLISMQDSAALGPHYHAETDTLDKIDPHVMKRNATILAALVYGFANAPSRLPRQSRNEARAHIERAELEVPMKMFGVYESWKNGHRAWN